MGMFADLHKLDHAPADGAEGTPTTKLVPPARANTLVSAHVDAAMPARSSVSPQAPPAVSALAAPPVDDPPLLDLREMPYRKDTFLFTNEEFEALEDLKLRVRREFDLRVTKNDLARCAIAYLVDDVRRQGANSPVLTPLTRRRSR